MNRLDRFTDPNEKLLAALMLAPAFMLLALIVVYPIGKLIWNSFFDLRLSGGAGTAADAESIRWVVRNGRRIADTP